MLSLFLSMFLGGVFVQGSPLQCIVTLSTSWVDNFTPFTEFASAAYCPPNTTVPWTCGPHCQANSDFIPAASGGDGAAIQFWYVGFSPSFNTIIVAHQGTNSSKIQPLATDATLILESLNMTTFPGVDSSVKVHSGFADVHSKTADDVLSAVKQVLALNQTNQITVVGHSLGAAIALLDTLFLYTHLSGVSLRMIGFGMPRVGNQVFADWVDRNVKVTHVNNKKDFVPIIPGKGLGYHHPSGEIHINEKDQWQSCPGQDNPSKLCVVGDVPNVFKGDEGDHHGPYNGVAMGCLSLT